MYIDFVMYISNPNKEMKDNFTAVCRGGIFLMGDRGFFFTTQNGNTYYYNDIDGNVTYQNIIGGNNQFVFGHSKQEHVSIDKSELQSYLSENAGSQLILLTTESCNIRCKYCIYSGNYSNQRTHNLDFMDSDTAKKAVKTYLEKFRERKYKKPLDNPLIAFYGGESLLNFKLLQEIVYYSKEVYQNRIWYSTTTNATLLTDEKIDFLAKHQFILSISLNGNKEEHDRLRVFSDGTGTYDIIIKNLSRIREMYPQYFKEYCQLLLTIDTGTDLHKMRDFFKEHTSILPKIARISQVGASFTDWYDRYSIEDRNRFLTSLDELREIYKQQLLSPDGETEQFLNILFNIPIFGILNRSRNIPFEKRRPSFLPYTGACVPGEKIAVDAKGKLHVCERINQSRPIGDIENWLNITQISDMLNSYLSKVAKSCINCPIQSICELCYPGVIDENGEFDKKNMTPNCQEMRESIQAEYINIWNMIESGAGIDKLLPNVHS